MNSIHILPLSLGDWHNGVAGFTLEQEGFYLRLLRRLYAVDGRLRNDDTRNARTLCLDPRAYRRLLDFLLVEGKIQIVDGHIIQPRALADLGRIRARQKTLSDTGKQHAARRKTQAEVTASSREHQDEVDAKSETSSTDFAPTSDGSTHILRPEVPPDFSGKSNDFNAALMLYPKPKHLTVRKEEEESKSLDERENPTSTNKYGCEITRDERATPRAKFGSETTAEIDAALNDFNAAAIEHRFARCSALTEDRATKLRRRLIDLGHGDLSVGREKFREALSAIPHDRFLAGKAPPQSGKKPFRLTLDFLLGTKSQMGDVLGKLLDLASDHGPATPHPEAPSAATATPALNDVWAEAIQTERAEQMARQAPAPDSIHAEW